MKSLLIAASMATAILGMATPAAAQDRRDGVSRTTTTERVRGDGRIDRHVLDSLPELRCSCLKPFDHRGAGATGALSQQPLLAVQIDEPGVPRIHPHPPLRFAPVRTFPRDRGGISYKE